MDTNETTTQATNITAMPKLFSDPYDAGKREALRAVYEHYFTLGGDAVRVSAQVMDGSAPVEFKEGFMETVDALRETLDRT